MKYRLKLELIDNEAGDRGEAEDIVRHFNEASECNGFALLSKTDKGAGYATISDLSLDDLASLIMGDSTMMAASALARGKSDAIRIMDEAKGKKAMAKLLGALKGGADE